MGGGVYWLVPSGARGAVLVNNTISGNNSPQGSGLFADGFDAQIQLINNIIVAAAGQNAVVCGNFDSSTPTFQFNDVVSASGLAYAGICTDRTGLNGNVSADPLQRWMRPAIPLLRRLPALFPNNDVARTLNGRACYGSRIYFPILDWLIVAILVYSIISSAV